MSHAFDLWRKTNFGQKASVASLVFLFLTLPLGVILALSPTHLSGRAQTTKTTSLYFSPREIIVAPANTFEVTLFMATGEGGIAGADIQVMFDKNLIQATNIEVLDFLPVTLQEPLINNEMGKVTFVLGSEPTNPKIGTGKLAKLIFRATEKVGEAKVSFDSAQTKVVTLENPSGSPIETTDIIVQVKQ